MNKFFNISNHPSAKWTETQRTAAAKFGEIVDVAFPNVDPEADHVAISEMAIALFETIAPSPGDVVHVMGESGFVVAFVSHAHGKKIACVHSTTKRVAVETRNPDGTVTKTATFEFVQFRRFVSFPIVRS
jgi:hypothetical protein